MKGFIFLFLLLGILAFADSLYFPLNKKVYLTSSFGESRGTRYHAGIDYSTNMEEGYPIYAPENGTVSEIGVSPFGYGKVLYFKGESGKTWVFAHQSGFSFSLDSLLRIQQIKSKKNDVKLFPKVNFKKGEILSYAGSSGIGNPHLHLELREGPRKLYSPCQNGVACEDTIAPFVFAAASWNENDFKMTSKKSLEKGCVEIPSLKESFYIAFKIADYSREPFENPMSIWRLNLSSKKTIYEKTHDSLFYGDMLKIRQELLFAEEADTAGDWHYIQQKIQPLTDSLTLKVEDFTGNITNIKMTVKESCFENEYVSRIRFQDSLLYSFLSRAFVSFRNCGSSVSLVNETGNVIEKNLCSIFKGQDIEVSSILKRFPKAHRILFPKDTIYIKSISEKEKNFWNIKTKDVEIKMNLPPVEKTSWTKAFAFRKQKTDSLTYLEFHPKGLHFTKNQELCVSFNEPLYYLGETTRKWFYFSKQKKENNFRCVSINELRDIASIKDTTAPVLGSPYFALASVVGQKDSVLRIPLIEKESGIKNGNAINVFTQNGSQWIPMEYDSEPKELVIEKRDLYNLNEKLKVIVEDEARNQGTYWIEIPR